MSFVANQLRHGPDGTNCGRHDGPKNLGASASVDSLDGHVTAVVHVGRDQSLMFRESPDDASLYDGHHVAVYIADFSGPHTALASRGLVTEESNEWQYRFVEIVDLESGDVLYQLEHEVRSMRHPMFQRPLVNRDPSVTQRDYRRGADALVIG